MNIELFDGSVREVPEGSSVYDLALNIAEGLARRATAGEVNGQVVDLRHRLQEGDKVRILSFDDRDGKEAFWHTSSHVMAQAVKRLWPDAKLAIGPAIESGFYYDIDFTSPIGEDDLPRIEEEMQAIVREGFELKREVYPREEALALVDAAGEPYKLELIEDLPEDAEISFYSQGEFRDLCAGPHLMSTRPIRALKLTMIAGAYWRGSEKNRMLTRIYGISFPDRKQLVAWEKQQEEARARDHNRIGRELGYFTTADMIGQGLPIILPRGTTVLRILQRFVEDEEARRGYQATMTPLMAKRDLYKISGHWDHYRDGMFIIGDPEAPEGEDVFALRPMTCPFQFQAYLTQTRSYRDLPLRLSETSTLFRNESSGEMHGLIRVRQFTISEAHLIVRPDQTQAEFLGALDLAIYMMEAVGLVDDISFRLSLWDPDNREKYIGDPVLWEQAQTELRDILDSRGLDYAIGIGEAAFYGPKLDIQIRNVWGKEDTLITIQIDFQLAQRFGLYYTDSDGERKHPTIIHRTSIGCYERTLALLLEKYAGAMPLWLAPEQARLLPISERFNDYAEEVAANLREAGLRVTVDRRDDKIGYKISQGRREKIPYLLVVGQQEAESVQVSVRRRGSQDLGVMPVKELLERIVSEVQTRVLD
ncbi:MAG: threonine--tRNA ligase [Bacillota bacterium]|nr:threonine--tRNA ligase [Bacillota bacterium]